MDMVHLSNQNIKLFCCNAEYILLIFMSKKLS